MEGSLSGRLRPSRYQGSGVREHGPGRRQEALAGLFKGGRQLLHTRKTTVRVLLQGFKTTASIAGGMVGDFLRQGGRCTLECLVGDSACVTWKGREAARDREG